MAYAGRMKNDTTAYLAWSRRLADVCRRRGAETDALRTEAEIGSALFAMEPQKPFPGSGDCRGRELQAEVHGAETRQRNANCRQRTANRRHHQPFRTLRRTAVPTHRRDETIIGERLFLKPDFGLQTLIDRFHISKERVGTLISNYSKHTKINSYVQQLRLEYAAKLLTDQPDKTIVQIAIEKTKSLYTKN